MAPPFVLPTSARKSRKLYSYRPDRSTIIITATLLIIMVLVGRMKPDYRQGTNLDIMSSNLLSTRIKYRKIKEGVLKNEKINSTANALLDYTIFAAENATTQAPISVKEWAEIMATSPASIVEELVKDLGNVIIRVPYRGFYFETKGVTSANADQKQFEFCLIDGKDLADLVAYKTATEPSYYTEDPDKPCPDDCGYFKCAFNKKVVYLKGLPWARQRKREKLAAVAAAKEKYDIPYSHLAKFLRESPTDELVKVWKRMATSYHEMLTKRDPNHPVWLSTSAEGMPFVHFRFEEEPRYHKYAPFAKEM